MVRAINLFLQIFFCLSLFPLPLMQKKNKKQNTHKKKKKKKKTKPREIASAEYNLVPSFFYLYVEN